MPALGDHRRGHGKQKCGIDQRRSSLAANLQEPRGQMEVRSRSRP